MLGPLRVKIALCSVVFLSVSSLASQLWAQSSELNLSVIEMTRIINTRLQNGGLLLTPPSTTETPVEEKPSDDPDSPQWMVNEYPNIQELEEIAGGILSDQTIVHPLLTQLRQPDAGGGEASAINHYFEKRRDGEPRGNNTGPTREQRERTP